MPFEKSLDEPHVVLPALCQHLRSKAMYVHGDRELAVIQSGTGHCWCNLTQNVRGPDSQLVDRVGCDVRRPCYQASL